MKRQRGGSGKAHGKFKAAVRSHNAKFRPTQGPSRGISSTSVFQPSRAVEKKFIDVNQAMNVAALTATGTASNLINAIAQGTDAINHIGRQIRMKSLYWTWEGGMAPTSTGNSPMRLVIFYDKEANGAVPTIATGATSDVFNEDSISAKMNLNNRDRYVVLVDEIVDCVATAGPQSFYRKGYRKIDLPVVFNAVTTATISAIQTGSVYATVWQNGGIGTAGPTTTLDTRIRFEDA